MEFNKLESYDQLVKYLENWMSFDDNESYDFNGMVGLLCSCLRNLDKYSTEGDFEELEDMLEDSEKEMIRKLAKVIG